MPQIVINDITPRIQYYASAGQTVFQFPWPMFYPTDIQVYKRAFISVADDVADILTYVTNYTVTIYPAPAVGGYITLNSPAAANDIITLARAQPDERLNYYINGGQFLAEVVNPDFDKIVLMDQQRQMYDEVIGVHYNVNAVIEPVVDNILPVLPAGTSWRKNSTDTAIEYFNAIAGDGSSLVTIVTQPNHGFTLDQIVYHDGTGYALAQADTAADAEVIGIVVLVNSVNTFSLLTSGKLTTAQTLTPGTVYYLSPTIAGALQNTEPTTPGYISKPLIIASGANEGFFYNFRGKVIPNPASVNDWVGVAVNTAIALNTNYYTTGGGNLAFTLPVTIPVGYTIRIAGRASTGWNIVQNAGQTIYFGTAASTTGAAGSVSSTDNNDCIELLCTVADTDFLVLSAVGNLTVA